MTDFGFIPFEQYITGLKPLEPNVWRVSDLIQDCERSWDEWPVSGDNIARYRKALAS